MDIVWRQVALNGLQNAHRYIAQHNPGATNRVFEGFIPGTTMPLI